MIQPSATGSVVVALAAALALSSAVPAVSARPNDASAVAPAQPTHAPAKIDQVMTSNGETNAYAHRASGQPTSSTGIVTVTPGGFDWGDAGIGAAGGFAISMVGLGGALVISQHRGRRTRRTTALPS